MRRPRFSIAGLMAIVVLAALDCAAFRALTGPRNGLAGNLFAYGVLPMANILAFGLPPLPGWRPGRGELHPFWGGFEVFGWAALLLSSAGAILTPGLMASYTETVLGPLGPAFDRMGYDPQSPAWLLAEALVLGSVLLLPLLLVALLGGWLSSRFRVKVVIERRRTRGTGSGRVADPGAIVPCP
jgi:hypothetical protein